MWMASFWRLGIVAPQSSHHKFARITIVIYNLVRIVINLKIKINGKIILNTWIFDLAVEWLPYKCKNLKKTMPLWPSYNSISHQVWGLKGYHHQPIFNTCVEANKNLCIYFESRGEIKRGVQIASSNMNIYDGVVGSIFDQLCTIWVHIWSCLIPTNVESLLWPYPWPHIDAPWGFDPHSPIVET